MNDNQQLAPQTAKAPATLSPIKALFERDDVKQKFTELLGKRSSAFITSVLQIAAQNSTLAKADPVSIYQCAAMAATLDLPLNQLKSEASEWSKKIGFEVSLPFISKAEHKKPSPFRTRPAPGTQNRREVDLASFVAFLREQLA